MKEKLLGISISITPFKLSTMLYLCIYCVTLEAILMINFLLY